MKANDFINELIRIEKLPTLYELGTYLNKKQDKYILTDCSGLIKGILWDYPEKGKYASNKVPDINANTMIRKYCSDVSEDFTKLVKGSVVWMNGHIGVHIGNGICIESSPKWENGVQKTFIKGSGFKNTEKLHERKWTRHGKFMFIDYSEPKKSTDEIAKEVMNGKWGNGSERKERLSEAGYDYSEVQKKVNELVKKPVKKSTDEIAKEVMNGDWGNGSERIRRLQEAGYNYQEIQKKVNELLKR